MKTKHKKVIFAFCATFTMALAEPSVFAATWTGATDASWATAGNWTGTPPDNTTPQAVVYDATSALNLTQTLNASYTVTGITLTSPAGAVVVNNGTGTNTLTLGSGGIDLSAAAANLTLNVSTTVDAMQSWNVASGRTLLRSGGTTTFGTGTTTTLSGAGIVEIGGTQVLAGSGNLVIGGLQFNNNLQGGTQTRTGSTTLNSGIIRISTSISMFGTGAINLNGGAIGSFNTGGRTIGSNDVNIGGDIQIGGSSPLSTGFIRFNGATNLGGTTREITSIATGVSADFGSGAVFTGIVSNGGITKAGSGILTLNNNDNAFTGPTTVNAGDLAISQSAISNSSSVTLANNGVRLFLGENGTGTHTLNNLSGVAGTSIRTDFSISGTSTARSLTVNQSVDGEYAGTFVQGVSRAFEIVKTGAATLTLSGAGGHTLGTTVSGGTLKIGGAGLLGSATYAGNITNNATLQFDSSASQSLTGTITGGGALSKTGTGVLTISGDASGFSGAVTATGGRLILNSAAGGSVSVSSGATLGGSGSSTGALSITDDSTLLLAGGATTTGMSFNGVTFGGTAYLEFASSPDEAEVYDVASYGAGGLTGFGNLTPLARGTLTDVTANSKITFTAGAPGIRIWNVGDGIWNRFGILQNWAGGDLVYYQGDDVEFGNIASDTEITLDGLLSPFSVTVENTANTYIFTGTGGLIGSGFFDKLETGTLEIANLNSNFTGSTFIGDGTLRIIDGGSWGTGPIGNEGTLEIDQTTNLTLAGDISGNGILVKNGTGILRLTGASSYSGGTSFNSGILQVGSNTALGTGTLAINGGIVSSDSGTTRTLANNLNITSEVIFGDGTNGGQLVFNGTVDLQGSTRVLTSVLGTQGARFSGVISNGGITKEGNGRITLANDTNDFTAATTINAGILATSLNALASSGSVTIGNVGSGGGLALGSNGITTINNLSGVTGSVIRSDFNLGSDGARTLQINQTTAGEFAGSFTQGGTNRQISLIKDGSATLTLSGAATGYTGTTTVTEGTLAVTGSLGNTAVTVENGGTLAGNGNLGGSVTIEAGGTHALAVAATPGAQVTRTITGALDLSAVGDILTLTAASPPAAGTYILATATGGITDTPETVNQTGVSGTFAINGNNLELTVTGNDYDDWANGFSLVGGPGDDDDGDGLTNFEEYAFGLDPTSGASVAPVTAPNKTTGTFTYTRRKQSLTGLSYTYESSTTLSGTWPSFTPPVADVSNNGDPVEIITVTIPPSLLAEPKLFLRVKAVEPTP